jgi:hypothetical protein
MPLDAQIANNLFRQAGAVGTNAASGKIIETLNKDLFSKLGANNILGLNVGGFLGGVTASAIKNLLFSSKKAPFFYDPVWKLTAFSYSDSNTPNSNLKKATSDDLAGDASPKYKFNFTISFDFRTTLLDKLKNLAFDKDARISQGADTMGDMAFGLKSANRPNPTVNYVDINIYNYMTKVATKVDYGQITVSFYDDINHRAHDIFAAYLNALSPISNISAVENAANFDIISYDPEDYHTPADAKGQNPAAPNVASMQVLTQDERLGLIRKITLTQHLSGTAAGGDADTDYSNGDWSMQYIFYNPKMVSVALDDLDMTANDVSTVGMTFTYDAVYMKKIQNQTSSNGLPEVVVQAHSKQDSLFTRFLKGVDNAINPVLNTVNSAEKALNDTTAAGFLKSINRD